MVVFMTFIVIIIVLVKILIFYYRHKIINRLMYNPKIIIIVNQFFILISLFGYFKYSSKGFYRN